MNLFPRLGGLRRVLNTLRMRARVLFPRQSCRAFSRGGKSDCRAISQIHVINLDRQPERLATVRQELDRILDASGSPLLDLLVRHSACDARAETASSLQSPDVDIHYTLADQLFVEPQPLTLPAAFNLDEPIRMSAAEIAVARSHIAVWKKIAASADRYALVLEDDVLFDRAFSTLVNSAWTELHVSDSSDPAFDVLYLSYKEVRHGAPKVPTSQNVFRPERGLWYLSGYVLSARGAQRLLDLGPCRGPVDLWINQMFGEMDVRAVRRSVISQRCDLESTNSYSILPALGRIGVLNDTTPGVFHRRPTEIPVFAFGAPGSGLSSLAMALSMLGYRCCSDLEELPAAEMSALLAGRGEAVFNAYVNIASLSGHVDLLRQIYPNARVIVMGDIETREHSVLAHFVSEGALHLPDAGSWPAICQFLRLAPPLDEYPQVPEVGRRALANIDLHKPWVTLSRKQLMHDQSPWIVPRNVMPVRIGIHPCLPSRLAHTTRSHFIDDLLHLDTARWSLREDTFPGNLGLFRPANVSANSVQGAVLSVRREALGVRDLSAAAISSQNQFLFGRFEAKLQAANVPGLVTGFFLHRDSPRQEIDIEITGDRPDRLLVNVFYNPGTEGAKYDYGYRGTPVSIDLGFDASQCAHVFAIEWEPHEIRWLVDGRLVYRRVLWDPTPIPHLPMTLHVNVWPTRSTELAGKLLMAKLPAMARVEGISVDAIQAGQDRRDDMRTPRPSALEEITPASA